MSKALVITSNLFTEGKSGGNKAIEQRLRVMLDSGIEVAVFLVQPLSEENIASLQGFDSRLKLYFRKTPPRGKWLDSSLRRQLVTFVKSTLTTISPKLFTLAKQRLDQWRYRQKDLWREADEWMSAQTKTIVDAFRPDAVIVHPTQLARLFADKKRFSHQAFIRLVDTHDVHHERCARFIENGREPNVRVSRRLEREILDFSDIIVAIQPTDAKKFKKMLPKKKVITAMYGHEIRPLPEPDTRRVVVSFIGWNMPPNIDGIKHFISQCWKPLLSGFGDTIELRIFGHVCDALTKKDLQPNVALMGFAPILEDIYRQSHIMVNPVQYGSGLKIKNIEALCYARPLITTSCGAEGLEDAVGEAFVVADDSEEMIHQMKSLIEQPEKRAKLAMAAERYAKEALSEQATMGALIQCLKNAP